jgi:amino-acid N-acetyltransferase
MKKNCPREIALAAEELQRQLNNMVINEIASAKPIKTDDHFLLPEQVSAILKKESIAVVPAVNFDGLKPLSLRSVKEVLSIVAEGFAKKPIAKLIVFSKTDGIFQADGELVHQMRSDEMAALMNTGVVTGHSSAIAETAMYAIEKLSIKRVHIINGTKPDSLLDELFTKDGCGTMIYLGQYAEIRCANEGDISDIHALLAHYAQFDLVLSQPLEEISLNIGQFFVAVIDDFPIACARIRFYPKEGKAFLSSVAVNPNYSGQGIGPNLVNRIIAEVSKAKIKSLSLVSKRVASWWLPFAQTSRTDCLPEEIQKQYAGKNPTVLVKDVS